MKFFVIEITTVNGATSSLVTEKSTIEDARMLYHQVLASAYANTNLTYGLCMIINEYGRTELIEVIRSNHE